VLTDSIRTADEDNPNGYFELEVVKQLTQGRKDWLADADHKLVKVISALLEHLPPEHHYKILFMERQIPEILASQRKMLARRNEASTISDADMEAQFRDHLRAIKYWLARQPNMEVMYVDYNRMMAAPDAYCQQVADFIGLPLDVQKMKSVPNGQLYRNRAPGD
jgi:DNA-binding NtrC family response regulator